MEKPEEAWTTFSTALGVCGLSWTSQGIASFSLPETSGEMLEQQLKETTGTDKAASAPPSWVKDLVRKVKAHLKGHAQDFSAIPLSLTDQSEFMLSIYHAAQKIPSGTVRTYGELASLVGKPNAARAVGGALGKNPIPLIVPCHRVIGASGQLGGFSAPGGLATKVTLLELEGVYLKKPSLVATQAQWRKAVTALQSQDEVLANLVQRLPPLQFKPLMNKEPWPGLVSAIVSQQLSSKVAATILARVNDLISDDGHPNAEKLLNTADEDLRKAGLSFMKVSFVKDLATKYVEGALPSREKLMGMADEQIIREFIRIKGVGRWTAEMYLIFNLGRADVFPTLDFGVRKAISQLYGLAEVPDPQRIEKYGEHWKPYRSVASLYLWHSLNST
jgi:O-6-methylguanine DNA methyltransferase